MNNWTIVNKIDQNKKHTAEDIIKVILANRGYETDKEINNFLNPDYDQITPGNADIDVAELEKAKKRIEEAVAQKEPIAVYTDYDADGVCAGAIVWETLYRMGASVMPYIPDRIKEGYGLSKEGIDYVEAKFHVKLIVTVDHGITSGEYIKYGIKKGIDFIILDHHVKPEKSPKATAVIHTTKLSSGGIALIFSEFLSDKGSDYLELAAMATIADLIPLTGINRSIVKFGLEHLNRTKRLGLLALIEKSGLEHEAIEMYEVSYILVPRINAMGRLTHAIDALRLICTKDKKRAEQLATLLCQTNKERQVFTQDSFTYASELLETKKQKDKSDRNECSKLIFISHKSFKEGLIGLIAGKLAEKHYRPAIVVSEGEVYCKASARSIKGLDIIGLIRKTGDLLIDAGGHPMAAGFTFLTENLEKVQEELKNLVEDSLSDELLKRNTNIDLEIDLPDITAKLYELIRSLSPFGVGNTEPLFVSRNLTALSYSAVGRDKKHLKLTLCQSGDGTTFNSIGFGLGDMISKFSRNTAFDVVYSIDKDNWNGNNRLQLKLKDVKILND